MRLRPVHLIKMTVVYEYTFTVWDLQDIRRRCVLVDDRGRIIRSTLSNGIRKAAARIHIAIYNINERIT